RSSWRLDRLLLWSFVSVQRGNLQEVSFEWDHEGSRLITDPKDVLINWMALPASSIEAPFFSWFIK
ncbi:MAG: hypothetical protein ACREV1_07245, partial [Gammaproteobacteria bacterium]